MKTFTEKFESITTHVAYDVSWDNGTGYLNGAVKKDLGLRPGDAAKATDGAGRSVILIGTRFGNVVVFERFTPGNGPLVYVSNVPRDVQSLLGGTSVGSALTEEIMFFLVGNNWGGRNIGERIEALFGKEV